MIAGIESFGDCEATKSPMKPEDRVIQLHSPGRSFMSGWRVQEVPGVVVRICNRRNKIQVTMGGKQRLVNVDPEDVIPDAEP